ncbi:MAG: hypothetical protein ACTTH5_00065 [Wolinella sp.]
MSVTTKFLSDALGITARRVQELESMGVFNKEERNKWNLNACIEAYVDYKVKAATQNFELSEARAKKEIAEAELKELALAEKKGEMVSLTRLEKDLSDIAFTISNRLYLLPQKIKRSIAISDEVLRAIETEVEATLHELKDAKIYQDFQVN